jgi:flagellum-specific peptidoglycan hydrolase FlgJ
MYGAGGFISSFYKKVYEKIKAIVKKSYDFITEKFNNIIAPIFEKSKKDFDLSGKEKEYQQYFEEFEKIQKRKEQEQRDDAEKDTKYITNLANNNREKFERKRRLIDEINALEKEEYEAERRIAKSENKMSPSKPVLISPPSRPESGAVTKTEKPEPAPRPAPAPAPAPKVEQVPPKKEEPKVVQETQPKTASTSGKFSNEKDFIQALLPWAKYASEKLGGKIPPYAILGQWAGESGAGKALPADFNYAGIKAMGRFEKGPFVLTEERYTPAQLKRAQEKGEDLVKVVTSPSDTITKQGRQITIDGWFGKGKYDKAVAEGKTWVQVKSYFAKFKDMQDFADGFVAVLSNKRYEKAREQTTAAGFGFEVAKAGYATADAKSYSSKVEAFDKKYSAGVGGPDTSILSNAFTVTEPSKGKKIIYDSKEMFLGHRQQKKPVEYDVVNIKHTDNTKLAKNLPKKDVEKVDNASILLSRVV